jgi:hypothetical protein
MSSVVMEEHAVMEREGRQDPANQVAGKFITCFEQPDRLAAAMFA